MVVSHLAERAERAITIAGAQKVASTKASRTRNKRADALDVAVSIRNVTRTWGGHTCRR